MSQLEAHREFFLSSLAESRAFIALYCDMRGLVLETNPTMGALRRDLKDGGKMLRLWDLLPALDAAALQARVEKRQTDEDWLLLNFVDQRGSPFSMRCRLRFVEGGFVVFGEPPLEANHAAQVELMQANNQLGVLVRENAQRLKELAAARAELERTLHELQSCHWHIKKLQEALPICMECGDVKPGTRWENAGRKPSGDGRHVDQGDSGHARASIRAVDAQICPPRIGSAASSHRRAQTVVTTSRQRGVNGKRKRRVSLMPNSALSFSSGGGI